jgi:predicted DNA binding CopG/RHH family protein
LSASFYGKSLTFYALSYDMLHSMQQSMATNTAPSPTPSFAGLMAALASPGDKPSSADRKVAPTWEDDDLAEDTATLSYESALRAHSRYRSPEAGPGAGEKTLAQGASDLLEVLQAQQRERESAIVEAVETAAADLNASQKAAAVAQPEPRLPQLASLERNLKDASITIRLSKAECAQLHRRASEAGLTVSAYLRSCTFEAESLRAMVKETLAQLRSATTEKNPAPARDPWLRRLAQWMARLLNPWQDHQRVARA